MGAPRGRHRDPQETTVRTSTLRSQGVFRSPGNLSPSRALTKTDLEQTARVFGRASEHLAQKKNGSPHLTLRRIETRRAQSG